MQGMTGGVNGYHSGSAVAPQKKLGEASAAPGPGAGAVAKMGLYAPPSTGPYGAGAAPPAGMGLGPAGAGPGAGAGAGPLSGAGAAAQGQLSDADSRYGLAGLISVIRMTNQDLNTLALGVDLTTLGLNLSHPDQLSAIFAYPCLDTPVRRDPDYVIPHCYYVNPPPLKSGHLSKFQVETLFYIFYSMPKDTLQVYAAKELYNRDWKYHKALRLWFHRPSEQTAKQMGIEVGSFIYFDVNAWERRVFPSQSAKGIQLAFMAPEELLPNTLAQ
jgi:CCR4-NOT transcription complex subunit 2